MKHVLIAAASLIVVGACGSDNLGDPSETPGGQLIDVIDEPEGENCTFGGVSVNWGPDLDNDGVLDADEVTGTEYVCHGLPGDLDPDLCDDDQVLQDIVVISSEADFAQLAGYTCVRGSVLIVGTAVENVDGMAGIRQITKDLLVASNASLGDLGGLGDLEVVSGNLSILNNDALIDLSGLDALTSVGLILTIRDNDNLATLGGLEAVVTVRNRIEIVANASLQGVDALASLDESGGNIIIDFNDSMTSIRFPVLRETNGVFANENDALVSVELPAVEEIGTSGVKFSDDPALETISAPLAEVINGNSQFFENASLQSLDFPNVRINGVRMTIQDNPQLTEVNFPNLLSITSIVSIARNDSLQDLSGFGSLVIAGNAFDVIDNASLTSLTGLENLDTIGSRLNIRDNPALSSLDGLAGLESISGDLSVIYNCSLPLQDALDLAARVAVLGDTTILECP